MHRYLQIYIHTHGTESEETREIIITTECSCGSGSFWLNNKQEQPKDILPYSPQPRSKKEKDSLTL